MHECQVKLIWLDIMSISISTASFVPQCCFSTSLSNRFHITFTTIVVYKSSQRVISVSISVAKGMVFHVYDSTNSKIWCTVHLGPTRSLVLPSILLQGCSYLSLHACDGGDVQDEEENYHDILGDIPSADTKDSQSATHPSTHGHMHVTFPTHMANWRYFPVEKGEQSSFLLRIQLQSKKIQIKLTLPNTHAWRTHTHTH